RSPWKARPARGRRSWWCCPLPEHLYRLCRSATLRPVMAKPKQAEEPEFIVIKGAREHNLAIDHLEVPKKSLVVFTGVSGSGKSSLAFDTLYAEGQRRYVESLSSYARQFLGQMEKPKVEHIRGLSP